MTVGPHWRSRWTTPTNGVVYGEPVQTREQAGQDATPPAPAAVRAGVQFWREGVGWVTDKSDQPAPVLVTVARADIRDVIESAETHLDYWAVGAEGRGPLARVISALDDAPELDVVAYLQQHRRDTLRAIRNCHPDNTSDYYRWQGHAELARVLLTRLGAEVPQ